MASSAAGILAATAAHSAHLGSQHAFVPHASTPPGELNDAVITYTRTPGSSSYITVCKNWGDTGCASNSPTGILYDGEDTWSKYGWSDTDSYRHPSSACTTQAHMGLFSYDIRDEGWVKLSGLNGGSWSVSVTC